MFGHDEGGEAMQGFGIEEFEYVFVSLE